MRNFVRKIGEFLIIFGPLVGISPFVISFFFVLIMPNLNLYHWFAIFSVPIGFGVGIVGAILFIFGKYLPQRIEEPYQSPSRVLILITSLGVSILLYLLFLGLA